MTGERKNELLRIIDESWNRGNVNAMDDFFAGDCVRHRPPFPAVEGLDAYKAYVANVRAAFPDLHITVQDIFLEGDRSAFRWSWTGTHTGKSSLLPGEPTGKEVTVTGCTLTRSKDGKLVEDWSFSDNLGMLQQLGILPPLG
jgi:steroid delta-isomerase-like uncharacterized protein